MNCFKLELFSGIHSQEWVERVQTFVYFLMYTAKMFSKSIEQSTVPSSSTASLAGPPFTRQMSSLAPGAHELLEVM